jgi:hypothetical protein
MAGLLLKAKWQDLPKQKRGLFSETKGGETEPRDVRSPHLEDWRRMYSKPLAEWSRRFATNVQQVAHPYVQKVAGLPRRDSSQPDWKFLHQQHRHKAVFHQNSSHRGEENEAQNTTWRNHGEEKTELASSLHLQESSASEGTQEIR